MGVDFVIGFKVTIFWLNRGLRLYLDLYAADVQKNTIKYFFYLVLEKYLAERKKVLEGTF